MSAPSIETQVAVLGQSVTDCQRAEDNCRTKNDSEHTEIFGRLRALELLGARVAAWAALGSIVGGGIVAALIRKFIG